MSSLKTINNEIAQKERGMAARAQRKLLKREAKKDVPKRLGPIKYQAADLDLKLSDEIEGSLRKLKVSPHNPLTKYFLFMNKLLLRHLSCATY